MSSSGSGERRRMELGVGMGYLPLLVLVWMPVPEQAPEHGRGSKMAARRRKGATVERRQKSAARRCGKGVGESGKRSQSGETNTDAGTGLYDEYRGGGGVALEASEKTERTSLREVFAACISVSPRRPFQGTGRRSPPSRWTAASGITGTDAMSLPCLSCIFLCLCRAKPRIDNQPGWSGCIQTPPTPRVAA